MANTLYDSARELFLTGVLNWSTTGGTVAGLTVNAGTQTYRVVLVDTGQYPFSASHTTLNDVTPAAWSYVSPAALTSRTTTGGAADAGDVTFNNVLASSPNLDAIIIYYDSNTGSSLASTKILIAYIDTAAGLPIQPNGGDIIVTWDNGANKIFKL